MGRKLALLLLALLVALLLWQRSSPEPVPVHVSATAEQPVRTQPLEVEASELAQQPSRAEVLPDPEAQASGALPDPEQVTKLCVRVVARGTREPCAEAWVGDASAPDACDREGRIELRPGPRDRLCASATGFMPQVFEACAGHETPETALEVELERAASLVVVLEGAPRSGFPSLSVTREPDPHSYMPSGQGFFDAEGRATLDELPPEVPLRVRVSDGHSRLVEFPESIALHAGETRELRLSIGLACRVAGQALDERGSPVSGLELWIVPSTGTVMLFVDAGQRPQASAIARTDDHGQFAFEGVLPGSWRLAPGASAGEPAIAPVAVPFEILAGTVEQTIEYHVQRGFRIAGIVLDARGDPANGMRVTARTEAGIAAAISRQDGRFELGPLPAGSYELVAAEWSPLASPAVRADAGASDVLLRLQRLGRIAGRVVDGSTREPVAAQVTLLQPGRGGEFDPTRFSEPDGSFEFDGLPPGSYALCATPYDGRFAIQREIVIVTGGEASGLTLALARGARLELRGLGLLRVEQGDLRLGAYRLDADVAQEVSVPSGSVRLVLEAPGSPHSVRELVLEPGEVRHLDLSSRH